MPHEDSALLHVYVWKQCKFCASLWHDAPGKVTIKSRQGKIQSRMHADGRENAAWTPRHHGASDSSQTVSWTILDQSPTCCPSPGHLFRCCNPLNLSDFFSLKCSPCVKLLLRHQCGAVAAADSTCMVALPWHSVRGPEVPLCRRPGPQGPDRGGGFLHAHVLCLKPLEDTRP